jgi:hypothetical protein
VHVRFSGLVDVLELPLRGLGGRVPIMTMASSFLTCAGTRRPSCGVERLMRALVVVKVEVAIPHRKQIEAVTSPVACG